MKRAALALSLAIPFVVVSSVDAQETAEGLFEEQFATHWRAGDAEALAGLWVEDGDWSSIVGSRRVVEGRASLVDVWSIGLRGRDTLESRAIRVEVDHVRSLGDSHALVDVLMEFAPGTEGAMREAFVFVARRDSGSWRIVSARAARIRQSP